MNHSNTHVPERLNQAFSCSHGARRFFLTDRQRDLYRAVATVPSPGLALVGYGGAMGGGKTRALAELVQARAHLPHSPPLLPLRGEMSRRACPREGGGTEGSTTGTNAPTSTATPQHFNPPTPEQPTPPTPQPRNTTQTEPNSDPEPTTTTPESQSDR